MSNIFTCCVNRIALHRTFGFYGCTDTCIRCHAGKTPNGMTRRINIDYLFAYAGTSFEASAMFTEQSRVYTLFYTFNKRLSRYVA